MSISHKLTLRNYRCFDWSNPATLVFGEGFTALVGPNNSGKSSALRSVYELRNLLMNLRATLSPGSQYQIIGSLAGVHDASELVNDKNPGKFEFSIEIPNQDRLSNDENSIAAAGRFEFDIQTQICKAVQIRFVDPVGVEGILDPVLICAGAHQSENLFFFPQIQYPIDFSQLLGFARELGESRYFPSFRNAINQGAGNYYDIPVGTALVQMWDSWKAGNNREQKIAISRVEKEIAKLLGFKSLQINADSANTTLDLTIDDRPHKLYEVGAGVAQLIIVLAAAHIYKPPYILIDEPELSLHPSLQLNFLAALGSYAKKGLVYSTHSIGLARSTAQRIFTTRRLDDGSSKMQILGERNPNFSEWLGELNYSNRAELGCEAILLVEGTTDVLFFQEFLRKIGKDSKYIVMPLGGASLINSNIGIHIDELTRLIDPANIRIFIDSEKKEEDEPLAADRAAFISECASRGVNAIASARRATENYLEIKGITSALGDGYVALGPYELLKKSPKPWHKSENWKIARETSFSDIENTDFGHFLKSL